jgi:hypothetical protein
LSGFDSEFGISLPGNDIPDWFTYTAEGHSVCFEVPRINDRNIDGFTVCIVYSSFDNCRIKHITKIPSVSIINNTKRILQQNKRSRIDLDVSHEDHIWQSNFPESGLNLEAGDEVEVDAYFVSDIEVKKIGVCLILSVIDSEVVLTIS